MKTMKALVLTGPSGAEELRLSLREVPAVKPGWVLVRVRAFGMNHSEQILRQSEINAPYIQKPIIPGIECAGEVEDPSDTSFRRGQKVIALMGGMGRSFDGSYAQYALLPARQVFAVKSPLPWPQLAAVPETYYTAWGSLFEGLRLRPQDRLLVRGGTSGLGYAAIQLAKALGCRVAATTHREEKMPLLEAAGADDIILDRGEIAGQMSGITRALELVGPKTLRDSLRGMAHGGIVCHTGVLGGEYALNGFDPIKDIPNGVYLTGFFSNAPTRETIDDLFAFLDAHQLSPRLGKVFDFEHIAEACEAQDKGLVDGKIVVVVEE